MTKKELEKIIRVERKRFNQWEALREEQIKKASLAAVRKYIDRNMDALQHLRTLRLSYMLGDPNEQIMLRFADLRDVLTQSLNLTKILEDSK